MGASAWSYKDRNGSNGGVTKVVVSGGAAGKPVIKLSASGSSLHLPTPFSESKFSADGATVVIQLSRDDSGSCWSSTFSAAGARTNQRTRFAGVATAAE